MAEIVVEGLPRGWYFTWVGLSKVLDYPAAKDCEGCGREFYTQEVERRHCSDPCRFGTARERYWFESVRHVPEGIPTQNWPMYPRPYIGHNLAPKAYEPSKYRRAGKVRAKTIRAKSKKGKGGGA